MNYFIMKGFTRKRVGCLPGGIFALLLAACTGAGKSGDQATSEKEELPNIVYIISDDQAWTDYGFTGHPYIQTPHLDRLAEEGRTYTRGYSVAPLCRSEEHTSELQSLMRISYAVFCLKKKKT